MLETHFRWHYLWILFVGFAGSPLLPTSMVDLFFYCFPLLSSHTFYLHPSRSAGKVFPLCLCCRFCACFTLFPLFVSWRTQRRMEEQQVIRVKVQLFCSAVTLLHRRNPAAQKGNEQFQFPLHNTKKEAGVYSYRKHWRRFAVITPR